jgi:uncharacterized membrane protein
MFLRNVRILVALALAVLPATGIRAQQPFFTGLGDLPGGTTYSWPWNISADGSVVVGWSHSTSTVREHFRWTLTTGMVGLSMYGQPPNVSADGFTVVGGQSQPGPNTTYRWTETTGALAIPFYANWLSTSEDGSIVAGTAINPNAAETDAALWTEAGGVQFLPLSTTYINITDVSANGAVVVGFASANSLYTWSALDGATLLNLPSPLSGDGTYQKISDDGRVVSANMGSDAAGNRRGFRWTAQTGAVEVGRLPDGRWMSANGISADGSILVGNSQGIPELQKRPAIWDAVHGPRYLDELMINHLGLGPALAGWTQMRATGLSGDGRSVIGIGNNPAGFDEGWIAYLGPSVPEPNSVVLLLLLIAPVAARRQLKSGRKYKVPAASRDLMP